MMMMIASEINATVVVSHFSGFFQVELDKKGKHCTNFQLDVTYPFVNNVTTDSLGNPIFHPCITTILMETLEIAMNTR